MGAEINVNRGFDEIKGRLPSVGLVPNPFDCQWVIHLVFNLLEVALFLVKFPFFCDQLYLRLDRTVPLVEMLSQSGILGS